ncbi:hypothetical protein [Enterococcus ratti]|uniref:Flagellar motor switch protein n=1 Tax=Enterococcus ratti TaxID=150033 RepID=A0A1L8WJE3_9ENTE|nr:hypothetical protein [Enterococcus ratti]OJG81146.1 hypothetical protein RV14_GL000301 [Enterococcus ratti]
METEEQRKMRKERKKHEMQRLCRMLDIEGWDKNEAIVKEVKAIVHVGNTQKKETK